MLITVSRILFHSVRSLWHFDVLPDAVNLRFKVVINVRYGHNKNKETQFAVTVLRHSSATPKACTICTLIRECVSVLDSK